MQKNPERENLDGAKIYVDGVLNELKARKIRLDLKDYSTYGATLSTGFGGQYLAFPLSGLKAQSLLTDMTNMLNVCISYFSGPWRTNYPNGRIFIDGGGTTIIVCLGANWVNTSSIIDIMVLGI